MATEIGYRSVEMRRPMASGKQRRGTIALVVADISNPVYFEMIRGAEEEAAKNGYTMLLAHTRESGVIEREAIERSMDIVDGIVLSSSRMSDAAIRSMAKQKPTIVMNRGVSGVASVVTDNQRGVLRAVEHLRQLGHRDIAYMAGPEASWANGMRWRSLKECAAEFGIKIAFFEPGVPTMAAGAAIANEIMATNATAVLAYNDQLAIGFMRQAQASGFDVPGDISIVGFDNSSDAELVTPGLTSVAAPLHALGATAVRNLLVIAGGGSAVPERPVVLPTRLALRRSTAVPRKR
ncbi:substrate-binding domain-containing protein [Paeniglutamicibacter sp. ZC-3]|nr:substrate-binding domain-containing protein [Paeniglutamicibacter sp. ZC-3]MCV9995272.1 substrate-binding domain-containing protein [Paeniglutamicibacter sp. ZC-3]